MTPADLMLHVPHPKHCMADKFDSKREGLQCENDREESFLSWFPFDDILKVQNVRVWVCKEHGTYRKNGGVRLGPITLRAGAEHLQMERREEEQSKRLSQPRRSRSPQSGSRGHQG